MKLFDPLQVHPALRILFQPIEELFQLGPIMPLVVDEFLQIYDHVY
jgi:hypothetical protein